ncbi:S-adenosyl-L-methionine-dependent tRNA 4-demethylwyosine synthase TYW1 isoform X1 [Paramormyrops kingsleyae]|uniref:S-adenosyl-L-methionine-dependent tRNA 4-demethylwyosine synthase TYW1 isoform X1 n=2 Tax=Paramormyrops kingsleyae TaxID=1676925 RepID=UPI003B9736A3
MMFFSVWCFLCIIAGAFGAEVEDVSEDQWDYSGYLMSVWKNRLYMYSAAAVFLGVWFTLKMAKKKTASGQHADAGISKTAKEGGYSAVKEKRKVHVSGVKIFYGSQTGTAKGFAVDLAKEVQALGLTAEVIDMKEYDPEDSLSEECTSKSICVFLLATYTDGKPTENAEWFCKWVEEASMDFRYGKTYLKGMRFAVFGLGNSVYEGHYNTVGKHVDRWLWMLSATRVLSRGEGDGNVVRSRHGSLQADFLSWRSRFLKRLQALARGEKKACGGKCKKGTCKKHKGAQEQSEPGSEGAEHQSSEESSSDTGSATDEETASRLVVDVEDLGVVMSRVKKAKDETDNGRELLTRRKSEEEAREMITPALREALTKQGYRLIGSHSGVKLCRWTKSMLRGRGGCYKHTFYGIESHRCMEATPSLACANKCVFCWRHHTNPVGTEWRWKMDPPEMILQEAIENHQNLIKQFRGVPGVLPERFEEGLAVQHCALSLVGEPIMYPEVNAFIRLLHQRRISSFLVTNAQFPEEIRNLVPVTQLYVSVDASTKDSLKRIDRPLFKDFWQRFLDSLRALGEKQQRTVYRLTLVKAWNVDELKAYAELVSLGQPDFVEVKGVTYCGESSASSLTMANVPWHEEVLYFVRQLADQLPDYDIASEHEHSNCILIAHRKFKVAGEWHTWIDYDRFQELVRLHDDTDSQTSFSAEDYMARTPDWAVFGACGRGFDPVDTRFQRKNKTRDVSGC